jgi:hypothetical protein
MPDLVVDLSESYLKKKVQSAFVNAATCSNVYDPAIKVSGLTWYVDKIRVNSVTMRTGSSLAKSIQPGLAATPCSEVLADLSLTISLASLTALKKGTLSTIPIPITVTLRLDATVGGGNLLFAAEFHSVKPAKMDSFDLDALFKKAIPKFTDPIGLVSLAGSDVTVHGASMGRLASGTVRIGVGIVDATTLGTIDKSILGARWATLWSGGGPGSLLKAGEDWALLFTVGGLRAMALARFLKKTPDLKAKGIVVTGAPSISWDGVTATLKLEAEGEYEVPVCPDFDMWLESKMTFSMKTPPTLTSIDCTDAGLQALQCRPAVCSIPDVPAGTATPL